mmetsp:Transcript_7433/g.12542  ORF Transcript_7433/g.12542 Transcript_7433/m.12542 type:complete len:262 (+) Transcript_7433:1551-2336(+)
MKLAGQTAIVTGGGRDIGRAAAQKLASEGANVAINYFASSAGADAAVAEIQAAGGKAFAMQGDLTKQEDVDALVAKAVQDFGGINILVNNAGGPPPGMWTDWDRDDFIKALDANMLAPIALIKALVPAMMERGWGRVVNITSQSVKAPIPVLGLSNSARTGLTGYVAGTSRQVAGKGVTINNLLPGIHATDRAAALDGGVVKAQGITLEQARAQREATIPAGRYGTREEFGAACAFLCSTHAGFIVGQNLLLDGGATVATI